MNIGDHLVTPRTGYTHHGLYIGNGKVIHYSGFADGQLTGTICTTSVKEFANGHDVSVEEHLLRLYGRKESVERARGRLGEDWYSVLVNNCEHFVNWCINGLHNSSQVNNAVNAISVAYSALKEDKSRQAIQALTARLVTNRVVQKEVERQVVQAFMPSVAKSVVSKSAGIMASTTVVTSGTSAATTALMSSSIMSVPTATALAPVLVPIAVGVAVVCLIDWLWD